MPDDWTQCRRCGEPLDAKAPFGAPSFAGVAAAPVAEAAAAASPPVSAPAVPVNAAVNTPANTAVNAAPVAPPLGTTATPPGFATPPPERGAAGADGVGPAGAPADFSGTVSWNPVTIREEPPPSRSVPFVKVLVAVGLIAAAWLGFKALTAEQVPESIKQYASGSGEVFESRATDYSARFPGTPTTESMSMPILGQTLWIEVAHHENDDLGTAVMVASLPPGFGAEPEAMLQGGALGIGTVGGASVSNVSETTHQGYPASDLKVKVDGMTGWFRMIIVGDRAYAAYVLAPDGAKTAFNALVDSLVIGA